jgi:putative PIN family toxin of toxin-antitoxin system
MDFGAHQPPRNPARIVEAAGARLFELAISPRLLDEVRGAARKPRIAHRNPEIGRQADELVSLLRERAIVVTPKVTRLVARDPDDDEVLAVATAANATHVVSGDRDLLDDAAVHAALADAGIALLTPAQFANLLVAQG